MVHALQQTYRLLLPDGLLINVHNLPAPHMIEVRTPEAVDKVGWLVDREDFANERAALNALAQVVADGDFFLEAQQDFSYSIYADGLNELHEWLAEWWTSAILPDKIDRRLEELLRDAGQSSRIVLILQTRMTKLRSARHAPD
jgi:hypothetical protein